MTDPINNLPTTRSKSKFAFTSGPELENLKAKYANRRILEKNSTRNISGTRRWMLITIIALSIVAAILTVELFIRNTPAPVDEQFDTRKIFTQQTETLNKLISIKRELENFNKYADMYINANRGLSAKSEEASTIRRFWENDEQEKLKSGISAIHDIIKMAKSEINESAFAIQSLIDYSHKNQESQRDLFQKSLQPRWSHCYHGEWDRNGWIPVTIRKIETLSEKKSLIGKIRKYILSSAASIIPSKMSEILQDHIKVDDTRYFTISQISDIVNPSSLPAHPWCFQGSREKVTIEFENPIRLRHINVMNYTNNGTQLRLCGITNVELSISNMEHRIKFHRNKAEQCYRLKNIKAIQELTLSFNEDTECQTTCISAIHLHYENEAHS